MTDQQGKTPLCNDESPPTERTAVFIADPRAAALLLTETVEKLIESSDIELGIIDLSTVPGIAVAKAFDNSGVPFESLEYGQSDHTGLAPAEPSTSTPVTADDATRLRALASAERAVPVAELGDMDANIVLIPAIGGGGDNARLDLSPQTVTGAVFVQIEAAGRDVLIVDAPERGLRTSGDGEYQRAIIRVHTEDV